MGIITLIDEKERKAGRQHMAGAGQQRTHIRLPHPPQQQRWPVPHALMSPASLCPDAREGEQPLDTR